MTNRKEQSAALRDRVQNQKRSRISSDNERKLNTLNKPRRDRRCKLNYTQKKQNTRTQERKTTITDPSHEQPKQESKAKQFNKGMQTSINKEKKTNPTHRNRKNRVNIDSRISQNKSQTT